jgi:hypothetical protein
MKPSIYFLGLGFTPTKLPVFGENVKILFLLILSLSDAVTDGLFVSISKHADFRGLSSAC